MADKKISQLTGASTPLAGTEVLPIVQSGSTVKVASDDLTVKNVRSNATTGILQIAGPGVGTTRVMTTPNANFTAARTDAAQTFTGSQTFSSGAALTFSGITGSVALDVPFPLSSNAKSQLLFTGTGDYRQTVKLKLNKDQADNAPVDVIQFGPGVDVTVSAGNLVVGTAAKGIVDSGNVDRVSIASGETVVNESGADLNFRVEGDTNANLLFVDAGNDRVGIRTSSPNTPLEVVGSGGLRVDEAGTGANVVVIRSDFAGAGPAVNVASNSPLLFQTNNTERARITATGNVVAGASVALATTATDGFLYVPTCAGTPTGTPTAITGMAPIVVDTTNNKLYFYSGGQWRDAGP